MKRFVEGEDRHRQLHFLIAWTTMWRPRNPARIIKVFVDEQDLAAFGFAGMVPEATGRPAYHPATLLKISIYGYLHCIPSRRRLERETQRNLELIWLTGRLMPDFKTIADCRQLNLFTRAVVALDGSKFKAVNARHFCQSSADRSEPT